MIPIIILSIENEDDREFMSRLYLDYRKRMFAGILGYVSDRSAAEDVLISASCRRSGSCGIYGWTSSGRCGDGFPRVRRTY